VQETATALLNDQLAASEVQVRTLESSMEGVDLAQAKLWSQEKFAFQSQVDSLQARLDAKPSELEIMERVAGMITSASSSSLTGALPFVQALSSANLAPILSNTQNSSSSGHSLPDRLADIERKLGLEPESAGAKLGLLPRIDNAEKGLWGPARATPEGSVGIATRLALMETELAKA
jgi:hypothetical protein